MPFIAKTTDFLEVFIFYLKSIKTAVVWLSWALVL